MNTLKNCQSSSRLQRVAGYCPTSDEFISLVNDSDSMLTDRGDFYGSVKKIRVCIYGGLITWPRYVATPLALNKCGGSIPLHNHWYEFDRLTRGDLLTYWGAGCCGEINGLEGNTSPVFNQINCIDGKTGVYLRFYPTQPSDVGKTITVFGLDSNGEELRSLRDDGTFQDGIVVTLGLPFATMPASDRNVNTVRYVSRLVKDVTDGPVYGYQYRASDDAMLDLGRYEPNETLPEYQTTQLRGGWIGCNSQPQTISSLVKVRHIDAVDPNDLIVIEDMEALALAMQSIKFSDANDMDQKKKAEGEAIRSLNAELRKQLPLDSIPIRISAFGTALPRRHGIGRFT